MPGAFSDPSAVHKTQKISGRDFFKISGRIQSWTGRDRISSAGARDCSGNRDSGVLVCSACSGCYVWNYGFCSQKSDKKRERHRARRREEKRAVLNYDDIQTYEDVSHEFMGTDITDEIKETEEKEVPEDAEADEKSEQGVSAGSGSRTEEVESEKTETEDTELPQKAERDDPEQGRPSQMSEGKPEA